MVKRKRTLSTKDNIENTSQNSEADQIHNGTKRLKPYGTPEEVAEGRRQDINSSRSDLTHPTASIVTLNGSQGSSQTLSDVPLQQPVVPPIIQIRTSARVLNKQRREETRVENVQTTSASKKSDIAGLDTEYGDDEEALGKKRRTWKLWSREDKDIFFESINECGKDFEAIQNYLTTKLRKKGTPGFQIKNKDQVRHCYYRTWHKISKYIKFPDGVKKATQELYGLINYGALRKKIGSSLDEKKGQKLQELIREGSTSVRVKGKSVCVRTPICRALKKLNQIEEHREHGDDVRVPLSITVEIVPASIHAWCHVQSQAHNPRVRITTSLQRPLAGVISHLQEKWRKSELKLRDTLCWATFPLELKSVKEAELRLLPPKGTVIKPISVNPRKPDVLKSSAVSLLSHEERLRRIEKKLGNSNKQKETKPSAAKGSAEGLTSTEIEGPPGEGEGEGLCVANQSPSGEGLGDVIGCDIDFLLGVDVEDIGGEVSQEELEDGSDGEGCLNSPDGDPDDVIMLSPDGAANSTKNTVPIQVKMERPDSPFISQDPLETDVSVKEECDTESTQALRQLLALETVANAGATETDGEVVCVGESTRLTANVDPQKNQHIPLPNQASTTVNNIVLEEKSVESPCQVEERDQNQEDAEKSEEDIRTCIEKIQQGWTQRNVEGITIGELYLLFGQNKKLNLEYEFEEPEEPKDEKQVDLKGVKEAPQGDTPPRDLLKDKTELLGITPTKYNVPGVGMAARSLMEKEAAEGGKKDPESADTKEDDEDNMFEGESKRAAVENLSGMMMQLMSMARALMVKPSLESCPCGHVCGRGNGGFRSPTASKGQGLMGFGRSPCSGRSPRGCRGVGGGGGVSPNGYSPGFQPISPLAAKTLKERNKPASAKRLIPDIPDSSNIKPGELGSSSTCNGVEVTFLPSISSTANPPMPVSSLNTQDPGSQLGDVRVVVGAGGDGGEFRVPVAPAPRQVHTQQANFNAQLNKFLPKYNNRPGRRVVRKNVVVQRHLPILPNPQQPTPGVVTVKMLAPSMTPQLDSSFNNICLASKSQSNSTAETIVTQNLLPKPSSSFSSSTPAIHHQLLQPVQSSLINHNPSPTVQLSPRATRLTVPPNPPSAMSNAISVNVSGQPLLTVEMPTNTSGTNTSGAITIGGSISVVSSTIGASNIGVNTVGAPGRLNRPSTSVEPMRDLPNMISINSPLTVTPVTTESEINPVNGLLSNIVSQALSDLPDLSTPPGTPQPSQANKLSPGNFLNFLTNGNTISVTESVIERCPRIPSPSLFNSSLSLDSLPGGLMTNTSLVSTPLPAASLISSSPSLSTNIVPSVSPLSKLLTPACSRHLQLSPPPTQTNAFASLLNTPTPHSRPNLDSSSPVHNVSPRTPPSLSAFLSASSPPHMNKSFTSLLSPDHDHEAAVAVHEIHIPECSVNLPLLDISLGGTVTLKDQTPNLLGSQSAGTIGTELPSVSTLTTSTPSMSNLTNTTTTMGGMISLQETSSDKLLDITLGISNSNSSFSSLLAAATAPQALDSELLGAPSLISENIGIPVANTGSGSGVGGITSFQALSPTPPSPPSSPSRLLQQSDNQWLNNEVNDFSLSSLLGHFESPIKGSSSRGSSQHASTGPVLQNLISVYNENSVDFTAKFAEMKAQASGSFKQ